MTSYGCCVCLEDVFDMWGDKYYCPQHYKEVTQKARLALEELADAYSENREDVTENLQAILNGTEDSDRFMIGCRIILAKLHTPSGVYRIEYDTLTTMLSDVSDGETNHLHDHKYYSNEGAVWTTKSRLKNRA